MIYSSNENIILTDSTDDYVDYQIYKGYGNLIFSGRAYKYPDATNIKIDVTDICHAEVTGPVIDNFSSGHVNSSGRSVYFTVTGTSSNSFSVNYYAKPGSVPQSGYSCNEPISRTIDPRQYLFPGSISSSITITRNGSAWYSGSGGSVSTVSLGSLTDGTKLRLTCASNTVDYVVKCGAHYALYYQNLVGGIDSVTCYGPSTRTGSVTRYSITNNNATDFKNENKAVEGQLGWNLITGPISDEGGEHIPDLLMSNHAWLHDLETGDIVPVNIVTTSIESKNKKKDKNNTSYNIQVQYAQTLVTY